MGADDSLEHYACCEAIWSVGKENCGIPDHCFRRPSYFFLMVDEHPTTVCGIAWLIYAAMRTFDQLRNNPAMVAAVMDNWDPLLPFPLPPLPPSSLVHGCPCQCMRTVLAQRYSNPRCGKRVATGTVP